MTSAAELLASAHVLPTRWADRIAGLTAAAVGLIAIFLPGSRRKSRSTEQPASRRLRPPSARQASPDHFLGLCVALGVAALQLSRGYFPRPVAGASDRLSGPIFEVLDRLHNGIVGDYVAWLLSGVVVFGGALAFG